MKKILLLVCGTILCSISFSQTLTHSNKEVIIEVNSVFDNDDEIKRDVKNIGLQSTFAVKENGEYDTQYLVDRKKFLQEYLPSAPVASRSRIKGQIAVIEKILSTK